MKLILPCCVHVCADHGLQEMQLVLLRTEEPGPDMRVMLSSHFAAEKLTYLQGSPFVTEVCVCVCVCVCVFAQPCRIYIPLPTHTYTHKHSRLLCLKDKANL